MRFRTRSSIAAVAVASVIGGGVAGAVLTGPVAAVAQEAEVEADPSVVSDSFQTIEDVLAELVDEGVITQEQADTVGERLEAARPHRGFRGNVGRGFIGGALDDVATTLGVTVEDLGAALREGSSLADIAAENNVDIQEVIDLFMAQAQERLDAAVADGRLTADEAAERATEIESNITAMVNGEMAFGHRGGFGHRGFGGPTAEPGDAAEDAVFNA
jgi:polyhydroxyalkanoate synthesis regulator phasin